MRSGLYGDSATWKEVIGNSFFQATLRLVKDKKKLIFLSFVFYSTFQEGKICRPLIVLFQQSLIVKILLLVTIKTIADSRKDLHSMGNIKQLRFRFHPICSLSACRLAWMFWD